MRIDSELIAKGERRYMATKADENRAIHDPKTAPFLIAMKLGGYVPVLEGKRSVKLRVCPICPYNTCHYAAQYRKDGVYVWGCPYCHYITES